MKKIFSVLLIMLLAGAVMAQTVNPRLLNLSEARASLAGTDEVYVRSIYYAGEELSVLLKYDGENGAVIYGPYFEKDKVIPDGIELGYVRFSLEGSDKITITNIIINDNEAYSGVVKWDNSAGLSLTELNRIRPPKTSDQLIADLDKKYQGQITRLNDEISTLRASTGTEKELQTQIAELNSEISTLRASAGAGVATGAARPIAGAGGDRRYADQAVRSESRRGRRSSRRTDRREHVCPGQESLFPRTGPGGHRPGSDPPNSRGRGYGAGSSGARTSGSPAGRPYSPPDRPHPSSHRRVRSGDHPGPSPGS